MVNQASEDELKKRIGSLHAYNYEGDDVTVKVMVDEDILESIAKFVESIIRHEKLKLLAEARSEQVDAMKSNLHDMVVVERENYTPAAQSYALKRMQEINGELAKLEAEL